MSGCLTILNIQLNNNVDFNNRVLVEKDYQKGIAPFDTEDRKTSITEVTVSWSAKNMELHTPSYLPNGLVNTAVYANIKENNIGNLVILTYSAKNYDKIATAEIVIEIFPRPLPFDPTQTKTGNFTEVNGWKAYVNTNMPVSWSEYEDIYSTTSSTVLSVQIEDVNYWIRCAPVISLDELFKIAESL